MALVKVPLHARAGWIGRGHRFAACPRCSTDWRRVRAIGLRSERDFHTLLASVIDDVQRAVFYWRLYRKLRADVRSYAREFNEAPAFWSLTMSALGDAALFRLARLYDPHGGLSLGSLVETIQANAHLFEEARFRERLRGNPFVDSLAKRARRPDPAGLKRDRRSVSDSERLVAKLLVLRNRVLAHRDPRVVVGAMRDPISDLTVRQVAALLTRASRIVNRYSILFSASSHLMRIMGEDDYRRVLDAVRERAKTRRRRFSEELKQALGPRSRRTRR